MLIRIITLTMFLVSLPWVWYSLPGIGGVALRPAVLASIPLAILYFLNNGIKSSDLNGGIIGFVLVTLIVWILPIFYNEFPHWSTGKVLSMFVYAIAGYFSARIYIEVSNHHKWKLYWPYIGLLFLLSCMVSFYYVFGTLIPDTSIASSSGFIQHSLYGNMFDPTQAAGRGIRHTMAIVPTILLALVVHNKKISPKINILITLVVIYLVLYTFSRSAWLAAALMVLLIIKSNIKDLDKNAAKVFFSIAVSFVLIVTLMLVLPEKFSWVGNMLTDRLSDSRSTDGRLWVIWHTITDTTSGEYLMGSNRIFQHSPHNLMLDSLMQSGILGSICAIILFYYAAKVYFKGVLIGGDKYIIPAAFIAPALVRMLTAGSGMLHIAEIFGLCLSLNYVYLISRSDEAVDKMGANSLKEKEASRTGGRLLREKEASRTDARLRN